jgi:hypothetical protein
MVTDVTLKYIFRQVLGDFEAISATDDSIRGFITAAHSNHKA